MNKATVSTNVGAVSTNVGAQVQMFAVVVSPQKRKPGLSCYVIYRPYEANCNQIHHFKLQLIVRKIHNHNSYTEIC